MSNVISENTKVKLSFVVLIFGGLVTSITWVGTIQADVSRLKEDRIDLSEKVDRINENTNYIRGILDAERNSKHRK